MPIRPALLKTLVLTTLAASGAACAAPDAAPSAPEAKSTPAPRTSPSASDYLSRQEVRAYLKTVSEQYGIPLEWLETEIAVARYSPLTERYMTPKPKANKKTTPDRNYLLYQRNLVNEERIARGADFLKRHAETFSRVEAQTGVSRYAVAAVIGVETIYGKNMGRFRVLDALVTLSFDYTRRAKYYRTELGAFLDFCWRQKLSPVTVLGSFAGAMGLGQFMPSSLDAYGVDGDGDGRIDIVESEEDGIASVANFLQAHGWARGIPPLYPAAASREIFAATGSGGITAHTTAGSLIKAGVKPEGDFPLRDDEPALLVDLPWIRADNTRGTHWYIGTRSFAAILRYNRSYFYAAAVSQLADRIMEREAQLAAAERTEPRAADAKN